MTKRVFLAGASRGVGREIAQLLVNRGDQVVALVRSPQPELTAMGITLHMGDALDLAAVEQAMLAQPLDAVISTIGGLPKDGQRADFLGNRNLIDAASKAGVAYFLLVTSLGTGDSAQAIPPQALATLQAVLLEKAQAEAHLIASGLAYTIIRPGGLKSEPATGTGVLTEARHVAGSIHRADVADLVCQCLDSEAARGKTLAAFDRHQMYGQPEFSEFIP